MQWLINIIYERVLDLGIYHDRGDVGVHDFETGDLTQNNAWHTLDLSAIVPPDTKNVYWTMRGKHPMIRRSFKIRKHSYSGNINVAEMVTQGAGIEIIHDRWCPVDADRIIDYWLSAPAWDYCDLTVRGWSF